MNENLFGGKIDAYVIFSPQNRFYFTDFKSSFGCLILTENEKTFITDSRYMKAAQEKLEGFNLIVARGMSEVYKFTADVLKKADAKTIGFEDKFLTVCEYKTLKNELSDFKFTPASANLEALRIIKSADEIAKITEAQRIAERALKKIMPLMKPGVTERDMAAELAYEAVKEGADCMSFDTIFAFGENSAKPHHVPSAKKLEKNDIILLDYGVKYQGYCSDMTRTFFINDPNPELASIHNIVLEAQNYALKHIKAGMTCHEADSLAREYIRANGYDKEFGHSLGHGVGLDIHEAPYVRENGQDVLLDGMVITVEPGIYIDGLGGVRIEDMVVVREDGIENLTDFEKTLEI